MNTPQHGGPSGLNSQYSSILPSYAPPSSGGPTAVTAAHSNPLSAHSMEQKRQQINLLSQQLRQQAAELERRQPINNLNPRPPTPDSTHNDNRDAPLSSHLNRKLTEQSLEKLPAFPQGSCSDA